MELQIIQAINYLVGLEVPATISRIEGHLPGVKNMSKCLKKMIRLGYIVRERGEYWVTGVGNELLQDAIDNPRLVWGKKYYDWRDEVETGMDEDGNQSKMCNPVLPKSCGYQRFGSPEDSMINSLRNIELVEFLQGRHPGIDIEKIADLCEQGLVDTCKKCGDLGIFRRDRSKKSGRRSVCKYCERMKRGKQ